MHRESPTFVDILEADAVATPSCTSPAVVVDDTPSLILSLLGPSHRNDITIIGPGGYTDDDAQSISTSGAPTRTTADLASLGVSSLPPFRSFNEEQYDPQQRWASGCAQTAVSLLDNTSPSQQLTCKMKPQCTPACARLDSATRLRADSCKARQAASMLMTDASMLLTFLDKSSCM